MSKKLPVALCMLLFMATTSMAQVRINEVGYNDVTFEGAASWVELYNAGSTEVDVASLVLCDFPAYPTVNTLTVLGSSGYVIPADGYLVLAWAVLDSDAEVGLYKAGTGGSGFGDFNNMLDYMQYGSAGHQRESVAVSAGVWVANEFVASSEAGMSLQFVDNGTPGSGNWVTAAATPNEANQTSTSIDDFDEAPNAFRLHANYPNPFNPTTAISYDLQQNGNVHLAVYDVFGREIAELVNNTQASGTYSVNWNGQDASGQTVASGVYFYRLTLDGITSRSRVMTLLK